MTVKVDLGSDYVDHFPVFESDGYTKKSGETSFTVSVWNDSVVSSATTAVEEIGTTGEYKLTVTPDAVGEWTAQVLIDYNDEIRSGSFTVAKADIDMKFSAVDDDTTASFAVWLEREGDRMTDFTSVAAVVRSSDGTEVVDLGTDSADTSDGVFEFSTSSSNIPSGFEYYLDVTATRGSISWYNNLGFAKV